MRRWFLVFTALCAVTSLTVADAKPLLDRSDEPFRIMNWWSPVREHLTEKQVDLMVGSGLNFLLFMGYTPENCKRALGYASKYPWVQAIVWDERIFGASPDDPGSSKNIDAVVNDYRGYRAFKGFVVRDEPPVKEYTRLGKIFDYTRERWPDVIPYVNIYPNYVNPADVGAESYTDYIRRYIALRPPMVSYDHYPFLKEGVAPEWFRNLEEVRRECLSAGIPPWVIVQFSEWPGIRAVNEGELRWCVFSAMAYGFKSVCYFCYASCDKDMGQCAINLDDTVNTERYALLKRVNKDVAALGPVLMALTSKRVYHTEPLPAGTQGIPADGWVRAFSGGEWLIGEMQGAHSSYVMLINRNPHKSQSASVSWSSEVKAVYRVSDDRSLQPIRLRKGKDGSPETSLTVPPGSGELYCIELGR